MNTISMTLTMKWGAWLNSQELTMRMCSVSSKLCYCVPLDPLDQDFFPRALTQSLELSLGQKCVWGAGGWLRGLLIISGMLR